MKIAIFFLLVGLCSCNGIGSSSGSFSGIITPSQAETLVTLIVMMAYKYEESKDKKDNVYDKICLMDLSIIILKLTSGYLKCEMEILTRIVIDCLDVPENHKYIIKKAFQTQNPMLVKNIDVDLKKILKAMCCSVEAIIGKLSFGSILNGVLIVLIANAREDGIFGDKGRAEESDKSDVLGSVLRPITTLLSGILDSIVSLVPGLLNNLLGGLRGV